MDIGYIVLGILVAFILVMFMISRKRKNAPKVNTGGGGYTPPKPGDIEK